MSQARYTERRQAICFILGAVVCFFLIEFFEFLFETSHRVFLLEERVDVLEREIVPRAPR